MRIGLSVSFAIHASILLAAVIVLPDPRKYLPEQEESIPVELIELADTSQRVATAKKAKADPPKLALPKLVEKVGEPLPDAELAEKIKKAALEPQPVPEPEPKKKEPEPPKPDPVKELIEKVEKLPPPEPEAEPEPKKVDAVAKPVPVPRRKPKVPKSFKVAEKKPKKKKPKLDLNKLSALLNKIDDKRSAPRKAVDETGTPIQGAIDNADGNDQKLTGNEIEWLISRIGKCWSPPIGMRESGAVIPRIQFEMDIEGNVVGSPRVTNGSSNPLFNVAVRSAINAIYGCAPYSQMPANKYDKWRIIAVRFDPRLMLGIN